MKEECIQQLEIMKHEYDEKMDEINQKTEKINFKYNKMQEEYEQKIDKLAMEFTRQFETMKRNFEKIIDEIISKAKKSDNEINSIKTEKEKENKEIRLKIEEQITNVKQIIEKNEINNKQKIEQITIENQQQNQLINTNIEKESSIQFILINNILNNNKKGNLNSNISDFYDILEFLSKENLQSKQPIKIFDSIFIPKETTNFKEIILRSDNFNNQINELGFHSDAVEMLFSSFSFDIIKFMKYCSKFSNVIFEIKRSSSNFESILKKINMYKNQTIDENFNFHIKIIFDGQQIQKIIQNKNIIELISIGSTINTINEYDFSNFSSLLKISIPQSVKILKDGCFSGCSSLKQIVIPNSITEINSNSFQNCSSLSNISIPRSIKILKEGCFKGCSSLKLIIIPNSITEINDSVFENCISLSEITIPQSVTKIGSKTFRRCTSLNRISIPESVEFIGQACFSECSSLTQIKIPSKITIINDLTFFGCSKLKEIIIPESVTSIGDNAFESCSLLSKIDFPMTMTKIGKSSFSKCSSLKHIFIPRSVSSIGEEAFEFCTSLCIIGIPKIFSTSNLGISGKVTIIENEEDSDTLSKIRLLLEKGKIVIMKPLRTLIYADSGKIVITKTLRSLLYDEKNDISVKRITINEKSIFKGDLNVLLEALMSEGSVPISYFIHYQDDYVVEYLPKDMPIKNLPPNFNIQVIPYKSLPYCICTLYRSPIFKDDIDINQDCFSFAIKIDIRKSTLEDIHISIMNYLFKGKSERDCMNNTYYKPSIFHDYNKQFIKIKDINEIVQNDKKPIFVIWESPKVYDFVMSLIKKHLKEENLLNIQ